MAYTRTLKGYLDAETTNLASVVVTAAAYELLLEAVIFDLRINRTCRTQHANTPVPNPSQPRLCKSSCFTFLSPTKMFVLYDHANNDFPKHLFRAQKQLPCP